MNRSICALLSLALVSALTVACGNEPAEDAGEYEHVMSFDSTRARLVTAKDTLQLRLELAVSDQQKTMGLMERRQLASDAGMLFIYDSMQPATAGFWMYRTRIPLDIAFLDSAGVIRAVKQMVPCPTENSQGCPTYEPGASYQYALEMNHGYFTQHGVQLGHQLLLQDLPSTAGTRR